MSSKKKGNGRSWYHTYSMPTPGPFWYQPWIVVRKEDAGDQQEANPFERDVQRERLDYTCPFELSDGSENYAGAPQDASAFERQVGGTHYSDMAIQPALYVYLNDIGAREGEAIGYLSRWRQKGGLEDLHKAIHNIQLLIELETKYGARKACRVEPEESNGV